LIRRKPSAAGKEGEIKTAKKS